MSRTTFLPRLAGEFLVIVVGVLVALFVDGLREDRRERGYERQVLDAVAADLRANLEDLAQAERGANFRRRAAIETLLRIDGASQPPGAAPDADLAELGAGNLLASLALIRVFDPHTAGLVSLEASGAYGLIRDPSVRGAVLEYYSKVDSWREGQTIDRMTENRVKTVLLSAGVSTGAPRHLADAEILRRIRASPSAQVALSDVVGHAGGQGRWFAALTQETQMLLETVEAYIIAIG
ncbi:MAG: hypothetical protein JSU98_12475 [Gemmatimonadales bacterium]|nr:MAG: hypothetical protein JSU98_12475 [Gemmatimonadales bacterium]